MLGLNHGKAEQIERFSCIPTILGSIHANEVAGRRESWQAAGRIGFVETLDSPFHAAPSFCAEIAVELAKQRIAILLSPIGQVRDEVLDLLASGFTQSLYAAEIGGIGLDQSGIELMLADELAQPIADRAPAIVPVGIGGLRQLLGLSTRRRAEQ